MKIKNLGLSLMAAVVALSVFRAVAVPAVGLAAGDAAGGAATISGRVWLDRCPPTGERCIPLLGGHFRGDGFAQAGEPGLSGVTVTLTARCEDEPIAQTITDATGAYAFTGLETGFFCVTIDPRDPLNAALAPGRWTAPLSARLDAPIDRWVLIGAGHTAAGVDFGRDTDWIWPTE